METPLYFLTREEAEAKLGQRVRLRVPIPGLCVGTIGRVVAVHQRDAIQLPGADHPQATYAVVVSWEPYGTWFGKGLYAHALEELEDGRSCACGSSRELRDEHADTEHQAPQCKQV